MIISVADSSESLEPSGHSPEMNYSLLKCWSLAITTLFNYLVSPTSLCNHCISPTHYVDSIENNCGSTRCYEALIRPVLRRGMVGTNKNHPLLKILTTGTLNRKIEILIEQSNTLI